MFNNIKLFNPDFYINCNNLTDFKEVYQIFRDKRITKAYVYTMAYRKTPFQIDFLKQGMSHPDLQGREYQVGERVCRQISHLPGWNISPISDHGNDFYCGVKRLINKGNLKDDFNKNDLIVGVWDVTLRYNQLSGIKVNREIEATEWAEGELCNQYKKIYEDKPPLNYRDPCNSKSYKKGYVPVCVANNFPNLY
jgi:hypothetical protein